VILLISSHFILALSLDNKFENGFDKNNCNPVAVTFWFLGIAGIQVVLFLPSTKWKQVTKAKFVHALYFYNTHFMRFIKHSHQLKNEGHTLFSVQFLANQFVILSLLRFQILLTLSPFFPPSLLLSLQGFFCYLFKFSLLSLIFFLCPR
jgi:hypothetical protein